MNSVPPIVLVFAGNDPSGGAGLSADILTLSVLGCHALPVVTAITVQDTAGMAEFTAVDADLVADQARLVLEDMPVAAIKVGVIGSVETLTVIAEIAADYPDVPVIIDPVLATGGGDEFATDDLIGAMRELLLPHTTVLTPNSIEARRLSSDDPDEHESLTIDECALRLRQLGPEYVLVTGTHENTQQVSNALFNRSGRVRVDHWDRLPHSYHGSGCTLASAIAAYIAHGYPISDAVHEAQVFTYRTLETGFRPGMGQHIPDRVFFVRAAQEAAAEEALAAESDDRNDIAQDD
ncbi:hydroxymethylpyrimidine/phosphomethylpyrimidine kinase [Burkholderiaceae bacterium DAT-1]|nr:hydroxymethylpyrimidine/phosphomethylpyrimidine kinase [Burkholderiaceae bacterium DAT-1]